METDLHRSKRIIFWAVQFIAALVIASAAGSHFVDSLGSREALVDGLIWFEQTGLNAVMLLMIWLIIFRKIPAGMTLPLLATAHLVAEYMVITLGFHRAFSFLDLYPRLLVNPETNIVNPQSGTVMGFVVIAIALFAVTAIRRSFDRVFVIVLAASVAVTGLVFHFSTVTSINLGRNLEIDVLKAALESPSSEDICKSLDFKCGLFADGHRPQTGLEGLDAVIEDVSRYAFDYPEGTFFHGWHGSASLEGIDGSSYVAAVSRSVPGGATKWGASMDRPAQRLDMEKMIFSYEAGLAHIVWLLGALWISWLHSSRARLGRTRNHLILKNDQGPNR